MSTTGLPWLAACSALGALWVMGASWNRERGGGATALRGVLGGLAALATAFGAYALVQAAGADLSWGWLSDGSWPALGAAAGIGLIEEGAKLTGIALAVSPPRRGHRRSNVLRTAAAVAAVFAVAEAALAMRGASWSLALGRAALGPVAHALLAAPFVVVLAEASGVSRRQLLLRVGGALLLAAALHGFGDWSIARPGWGQLGFAAVLLAPALWLYAHARAAERPALSLRWADGSAARSR
jgi:RsiW-degrading membrane proteinase PrsW (M82 family)